MSRYHPEFSTEPMVQAVAAWKTAAFGSQKSLFLTDTPVWTIEHISELVTFFVENPDESEDTFWIKLEGQIAPASMTAKVFLVEILWLMLIFPRNNIKSETKRERILTPWKWSGRTDNPPMQFLSDDILQGIGGVGMFFNNIWRELKFAIILFKALLEKNSEYLQKVLNDPWEWGEWQVEIPDHGSRQFYHMLSFLLFPDDYESICSYSEKKKILISFDNSEQSDFKSMKPVTVDQQLFELRKRLEKEYGTVALSFYRAPLLNKWKKMKQLIRLCHSNKLLTRFVSSLIPNITSS